MPLTENLVARSICVLVPTYNNRLTLKRVIDGILVHCPAHHLIVVNDGCTDGSEEILKSYSAIHVVSHPINQGKGKSLQDGFKKAIELGFRYVVTIDSDGQHYPDDMEKLITAIDFEVPTVVMGSRNMTQEGVPGKSSFGNKFSNFWFKIETGITLPDTQTGFRVYPLEPMRKLFFFTSKFEFEIEVIVRLAWKNVKFVPVPIRVKYDPDERVSHFRPGRDFFRISVLNSVLVLIAFIYYYPKKFFTRNTFQAIWMEAVKPQESNLRKALSISFGFFMGIFPIWGFQLLVGIPLAILFRLNKVLFIAAANISIPPMIPFILLGSTFCGQILLNGEIAPEKLTDLSIEGIQSNAYEYVVGATVFALIVALVGFLSSYLLLKIFRKS